MKKTLGVFLALALLLVFGAGYSSAASGQDGKSEKKSAVSVKEKTKAKKQSVAKSKKSAQKNAQVDTGNASVKTKSGKNPKPDADSVASEEDGKKASKSGKAAKVAKTSKGGGKKGKKGKKGDSGKLTALPASDWSPNNFPAGRRGWCTWYADGRFSQYHGEKIELNPRPNSNAYTWFKRAQNVTKTMEGLPGDIMVIRRPKGDATGHVAFVEESVPGEYWVVTHANFDFGGHQPLKVEVIDGRRVFTDIFVPGPRPGTVKLQGGNSVYNLLGFLHMEARDPDTEVAEAKDARDLINEVGTSAVMTASQDPSISPAELASVAPEYAELVPSGLITGEKGEPDTCGCAITPRISN